MMQFMRECDTVTSTAILL